ncbi:hypothetical protein AA0242T_2510 [Acetobacter aceti NRIC 0242]|uniref:Lipoprotein n=1 Tax=Acetobacter aceti NBRC 14818 TaxID=887700 RepID=A0AB33I834_ACEAC|nr:hypothetical protein [Acetobacter aceti]BCK74587.1 hypothetical protein EMQ_0193 [Acetobacter aceti NBRC 14818]GAN56096.1 hypothetical protein Abac_002_245 [Acetobacter aceti NBRC 14818]GBO81808.1 hypothetical protein AA0242T_2510 [Acetobacter aceti NRIC 0242]
MKNNLKVSIFYFYIVVTLSGCAQIDPLYQASAWNAQNSNRKNLLLQVENANDLSIGRSVLDYDGSLAVDAIKRLRDGKIKNLEKIKLNDVANNQSGG